MQYTKQQLLDAFCESTLYEAREDQAQTKLEHYRAWIAKRLTPEEQAKKIALTHLAEKERERVFTDNKDVTM